ncbi:MAG: methyltransferase [Deltaproteobacteria bacterium]|nr:methyltransferase [Deltaproteobacteria bacterium]
MGLPELADEETCDALTAEWRVIQRRGGHRYSIDDVSVAWLATSLRPDARRVLDLGCGLGSVLLMTAWRLRDARLVGIEAQSQSFGLALRNLALNGCDDRVRVIHGDLRDAAVCESARRDGPFDLVTGTPPYYRPGRALVSPDTQRAYARVELRGGIEEYTLAAARVLADHGMFVTVLKPESPDRLAPAASAAGLHVVLLRDLVKSPGRPPFLTLAAMSPTPAPTERLAPIVTRDEHGRRTAEHVALRRHFGLSTTDDGDCR